MFSDEYKAHEAEVQKRIYEEFGVKADQVLQGKGKSNAGNQARTCLNKPKHFAKALGIDEQLVCNLSLILALFRCGKRVNLKKLQKLRCDTTAFL